MQPTTTNVDLHKTTKNNNIMSYANSLTEEVNRKKIELKKDLQLLENEVQSIDRVLDKNRKELANDYQGKLIVVYNSAANKITALETEQQKEFDRTAEIVEVTAMPEYLATFRNDVYSKQSEIQEAFSVLAKDVENIGIEYTDKIEKLEQSKVKLRHDLNAKLNIAREELLILNTKFNG